MTPPKKVDENDHASMDALRSVGRPERAYQDSLLIGPWLNPDRKHTDEDRLEDEAHQFRVPHPHANELQIVSMNRASV